MKIILSLLLVLSCAACAGPRTFAEDAGVEPAPDNFLPPPVRLGADNRYDYRLGPFDKVSVDVMGIETEARELTLDGQGVISFPMAGPVVAEGLTTQELAQLIEQRLRDSYMRNPDVSVNLVEQQSESIVVEGEVNEPGIYPVLRDMSLLSAVALAGGTTQFSQNSTVVVFRTVEDQRYLGLYDLTAVRRGNYADPQLYPGDTVVIGTSRTQRLLDILPGFVSLITTPLILLDGR